MARPVHKYLAVAISPDGAHVASVEGDETPSGRVVIRNLVIRATAGDGTQHVVRLPCGAGPECTPSSPTWTADGKHVAFVLRSPGGHAHDIYTVGLDTPVPSRLIQFDGTLVDLRYGPGDRLAVLATAGAAKEVGAVEAGAAQTGELGSDIHEQRIAIVDGDHLRWASPADLFVYEYDWKPDGSGFAGTAAPGDGDNSWWIAKLFGFDAAGASATVLYTPADKRQQLADPKISPDGGSVSFIAGIMSDFGSTGGDAMVLKLDHPGHAMNITQGHHATVLSLEWGCTPGQLTASLLAADRMQIATMQATAGAKPQILFSAQEGLDGGEGAVSRDCRTPVSAVVRQSFNAPPEIYTGPIGSWHPLTTANAGLTLDAKAQTISWTNDGMNVQGWLLTPPRAMGGTLPMITEVHGGPAAAYEPHFVGDGPIRKLLDTGYAIFLPNPRGSFGQGEAFTQANVQDFGHGDLRDIMAGITEAEKVAPIDEHRLGIMGWSYGGFMTMWTVTQTNRFRAAVAGAGISNWQSYYGENGIDAWMIPYFGASVYDDPAVYAKSSPMTFIKNVRTPTLEVVGERDIECPAPQTMEFWHALHDLGVPSQSVIYPGEGHGMRDPKHLEDFENRVIAWFGRYLK